MTSAEWVLIGWSVAASIAVIAVAFVALWHLSRDSDVPDNARLLEYRPPLAGRVRPPRRVPEEYFAAALREPARPVAVVYRSAPTPLPGWQDRTTQQMSVYDPPRGA